MLRLTPFSSPLLQGLLVALLSTGCEEGALNAEGQPLADAAADAPPDDADAASSDADASYPRKSCDLKHDAIASDVMDAVNEADISCEQHEDCVNTRIEVACSGACEPATVSRTGRAALDQASKTIAQRHCGDFSAEGQACRPEAGGCGSTDGSWPRCHESRCVSVQPGCTDRGCTIDDAGVCRGPEACDGCPAFTLEALGTPCQKLGQMCSTPSFCPILIRCEQSDASAPGWHEYYTPCE